MSHCLAFSRAFSSLLSYVLHRLHIRAQRSVPLRFSQLREGPLHGLVAGPFNGQLLSTSVWRLTNVIPVLYIYIPVIPAV